MTKEKRLSDQLINAAHWIGKQGWCPATSGNLSIRTSSNSVLITKSGVHKAYLSESDTLTVDMEGNVIDCESKPSAETLLHMRLYRLDSRIAAVLHTHSVPSTVISRITTENELLISGYEMQKALAGNHTHLLNAPIAIFNNDQDMDRLAEALSQRWKRQPLHWGFLVRGHGLYAWGTSIDEARRHLEGLEFLLSCEMEIARLGYEA